MIITPPKQTVCAKIDSDLLRTIDEIIRKTGLFRSRTDFIKEALIYYMSLLEEKMRNEEVANK